MVEAQTRLESLTLKPKKSVCLLVSAYKLVYLQSSCVAGFLIRSITGCKERDPEKGQTYKPEICSCFGHRSSISSLLPRTEPAPQICPDLEWFMGPQKHSEMPHKIDQIRSFWDKFLFMHIWSLILYCHASLSFMTVLLDTVDRQKHVNPCRPQTAQSRYKVVEPVSDYRISLQLYEMSLF